MSEPAKRVDTPVLGWGVALIVVGSVFTLAQLDVVVLAGVASLWPLLVIGGGLWQLATARRPKKRRFGLFLAFVGVYLLINTLGLFGLYWHDSWPMLLILMALLRIVWPTDDEDRGGGVVLLGIGIWLFLTANHAFGLEWATAWPLLLVLCGVSLIIKALMQALPGLLGGRS
jgi:hypothetical protein